MRSGKMLMSRSGTLIDRIPDQVVPLSSENMNPILPASTLRTVDRDVAARMSAFMEKQIHAAAVRYHERAAIGASKLRG